MHSTPTASISAIGPAVRDRLPEAKMTWKKMIRPASEKFTPDNIAYCQSYINFMTTADPFRVKFLDAAGCKLLDCANPKYGHSMKGQPCTGITRSTQTPNVTLNFLSGLNGVMYANTLNGASNTVECLNFFHEASPFTQPNGNACMDCMFSSKLSRSSFNLLCFDFRSWGSFYKSLICRFSSG